MQQAEIVLPITKPETEWVCGRALQKVSPTFDHARVQLKVAAALDTWSVGKGSVATEWRFRVGPPGEPLRPLVPDVAYVAATLLAGLSHEERQVPAFAPTVAVEVLSPDDRAEDVEHKIGVYLRSGSLLVMVADPRHRTIALHDGSGMQLLREGEVLKHPALPGFSAALTELFVGALD